MKLSRKKLRDFGYREFSPLEMEEGGVNIFEVALKGQLPFVAIGKRHGRAALLNNIALATLPESVEYLVIEGKEECLYRRVDGQTFSHCLTLPKADGTIWGRHSREDLLPLSSLSDAVAYAKELLKTSYNNEAIGLLLVLKLMDEASGKDLLFRVTEDEIDEIDEIEPWIARLAHAFGLDKEWKTIPSPTKEEFQKIVMTWQPYRFLSKAQTQGVFSLVSALLVSVTGNEFLLTENVVRLIQALVAGSQESVCIAGSGASGLLDIPLLGAKGAEMIGKCHPAIKRLGQTLLHSFESIPEDFLDITQQKKWPTMVCLSPFNKKIAESKLLAGFDLATRGRGKRSKAADAEILWLEKSHELLTEDGFLAIILTDGILSNASSSYVREWVQTRFKIDSVFSLPSSVFYPGMNLKVSLVCLRKMAKPPSNYRIFMAELEEKDCDDLSSIIQAYRLAKQENS